MATLGRRVMIGLVVGATREKESMTMRVPARWAKVAEAQGAAM